MHPKHGENPHENVLLKRFLWLPPLDSEKFEAVPICISTKPHFILGGGIGFCMSREGGGEGGEALDLLAAAAAFA